VVLQIVATYAFNKSKYADDPDCDIDFETMRSIFMLYFIVTMKCRLICAYYSVFMCHGWFTVVLLF